MKITRVRATPVNIPLEAPLWWTGGLYPGTSKTIVEVETDEGIVGLGEAPSADAVHSIELLGERLAGADPLDIAGCESRCVPPWQIVQNTDGPTLRTAFGAIEIALWDIRGKASEEPLYRLLGGAVRMEIPFTEYFGFRPEREETPEDVVEYCLRMRAEHGSTYFEGKLILGNPELEVKTVRLLREALGTAAVIRLDSNMQWSLATARVVLRPQLRGPSRDLRGNGRPAPAFDDSVLVARARYSAGSRTRRTEQLRNELRGVGRHHSRDSVHRCLREHGDRILVLLR